MAAETNTIKNSDLARIREIDFVNQFNGGIQKLVEALGVTRKIPVQEGTELKALTVTGTLHNGVVTEGDTIPLSKYTTTETTVGTITLKKWRKATTAEAIIKKGYDQAVGETTDKMVKDIQKGIRSDLFTFLGTGSGTASGVGLQAALANAWGQLQVLWEDDAVDTVYFLNPLDVSAYLGTAQISVQTVFGMNYIENFLGLGTVFMNSTVPQGTFYATAKENVILYYINVASSALAQSFDLTTDEDQLGYIGISEYPDKDTARVTDLVMSGVTFFAERPAGVVKGQITGTLAKLTVVSVAGTNAGDTAITVSGYAVPTGGSYVYKISDDPIIVNRGDDATGWTSWDGEDEITAATGKIITVAVADSDDAIIAAGYTTVTAKA